jgi:hypothetical protein
MTGLGTLAVTAAPCWFTRLLFGCNGGPSPFGNKRCPADLADHPLWGRKDLWDTLLAITLGKVDDNGRKMG